MTMLETALVWQQICFETYAVTIVATMLVGAVFFTDGAQETMLLLPLLIGAVCIIGSVFGTFFVRPR